jgi:hypothetical protein
MKTWLLALAGLLIIILLGTSSHHYLKQNSHRLCSQISRIDQALSARRWPLAGRQMAVLKQQWRRTGSVWSVFIHHQELDNIENALARLEKAIFSHDYPGSQMSSGELRHFLQHIPQRENFTLVNIL